MSYFPYKIEVGDDQSKKGVATFSKQHDDASLQGKSGKQRLLLTSSDSSSSDSDNIETVQGNALLL